MNELDLLSRLAVSLSIGLLVGLERGWQTREEESHLRAAGLRTFALTGLLGGTCGAVSAALSAPLVIGLGFLGFAVAFGAFHALEARATRNFSVTSVVAGLLTFLLGTYAIVGVIAVAAAGAVAMTLLLALRDPLHRWVQALSWTEIRAVLTLLAMTFLLLPILPDRTIDPWDVLNPARIWMLTIFIAALSFGGYVAIRAFGARLGILIASITGAMASSTATTLTLARLGRDRPQSAGLVSAGILIAGVVMAVRVAIVVGVIDAALLLSVAPELAVLAATLVTFAIVLLFRNRASEKTEIRLSNPLQLAAAIKMAAFIALILMASVLMRQVLGDSGILALAAVSGLTDVDAISISMAELASRSGSRDVAGQAVLIAVGVNTAVKAAMALGIGRPSVGIPVVVASALAVVAMAITAALL
ncbi:MgtC/SapB family protein [Aurantimonas sp. 22II-16-19i]|uniref:MgtC/SapB family protein n=1 Tax=Aurantimonas sp. 22II-16-19i TaxID=1317114 RepID=UPI0009F7E1B3|nr:MgtC/SapB family protein [Aurantimonas sp. 22II-16-19i]ORE90723.1 membrane protein [Aurantimonas sp. 22II-16-19i]